MTEAQGDYMHRILYFASRTERRTTEELIGTPDPNPNQKTAFKRLKEARLIDRKRGPDGGTKLTEAGEKAAAIFFDIPPDEREEEFQRFAERLKSFLHLIPKDAIPWTLLLITKGRFQDILVKRQPPTPDCKRPEFPPPLVPEPPLLYGLGESPRDRWIIDRLQDGNYGPVYEYQSPSEAPHFLEAARHIVEHLPESFERSFNEAAKEVEGVFDEAFR